VLLVRALGELLPESVIRRPKMTFTFPFARWLLQGDLQVSWQGAPRSRKAVQEVWDDFRSGRVGWSKPWALLVANRNF
jgi:hypothetical protein